MPQKRGLAAHVRSGEEEHVWRRGGIVHQFSWCCTQRRVVRNVFSALICLRETRMPRVLETNERCDGSPLVKGGSRKSRLRRNLGQGQKGIDVCQASYGACPQVSVFIELGEQAAHLSIPGGVLTREPSRKMTGLRNMRKHASSRNVKRNQSYIGRQAPHLLHFTWSLCASPSCCSASAISWSFSWIKGVQNRFHPFFLLFNS